MPKHYVSRDNHMVGSHVRGHLTMHFATFACTCSRCRKEEQLLLTYTKVLSTHTEIEMSALKIQRYTETEKPCFSTQRHMIDIRDYSQSFTFLYQLPLAFPSVSV